MFKDVKNVCFFVFCLMLCSFVVGQSIAPERKLIVFSGIVINQDNMEPIQNVTVRMHGRSRGTISNRDGRFEINVYTGDTLDFSHVSYVKSRIIIPHILDDNRYFVVKYMATKVIELPEVIVLPWATREEFVKEFVATAKPSEELVRVKENLELFKETMKQEWDKAANEAPYKTDVLNTVQRQNYYNGQQQPWYFLDVGTWYKFIKSKVKK